jgi:phosphoribosylamine--glycine ligase
MKVLVVGNGSREHAICLKLSQSTRVSQLLCAPGNPGIAKCAKLLPLGVTEVEKLVEAAQREGVELVVVGPEVALAAGVVDAFRRVGILAAGPTAAAAQLESSKTYAKQVMDVAKVPTAAYHLFTAEAPLREHCRKVGAPLVLKSDGLASGKGVFVITEESQFEPAFAQLFGPLKAEKIVAEEFLDGVEVSCIFATNGEEVIPLPPAHDYKRLQDNDVGPNTGGMGSVCPSPRINEEELAWVKEAIAQPMVNTMKAQGVPFTGFLYAGLMVPTRKSNQSQSEWLAGVRVLEFNARLGDPECQALLVRLSSDLVNLCEWIAGKIAEPPSLTWKSEVSTCVVIASDGYPEDVVAGDTIEGIEHTALVPGCAVFYASTKVNDAGKLVSGGGRTLSVVGLGSDYDEARRIAYKGVDLIQLRGRRVRRDIGAHE